MKPQVRGALICGFGSGQGRGRTVDLPIFSRRNSCRSRGYSTAVQHLVQLLRSSAGSDPLGEPRRVARLGQGGEGFGDFIVTSFDGVHVSLSCRGR